jgi:hypothetical protein
MVVTDHGRPAGGSAAEARSFHDPIGGLGIRSQPLSEDDPAGAWMSREEEATIATLYTILKRPWRRRLTTKEDKGIITRRS